MQTIFLTVEQVIVIHDDQIQRYGGSHGIANLSLLESAVMRPQTSFGGKDLYPDIFYKTATMMHSIIMNHAFVDGNKRTATTTGILALTLNGYNFVVGHEKLVKKILNVRHSRTDLKTLSSWLKSHSRKIK